MPSPALDALLSLAVFIAVTHTLAGPDHYVPFIAMARVARWSLRRTLAVTTMCGVAHVLSSVLIGWAAIALGWAVTLPAAIEAHRGAFAAWLLVGFGLAYMAWGIRHAIRNRPHTHWHAHADGTVHAHLHTHHEEHAHVHAPPCTPPPRHTPGHADVAQRPDSAPSLTPWVLFTIFAFGPCEPLIPILMYPAAQRSLAGVMLVSFAFAAATILTMLGVVLAGYWGLGRIPFRRFERYSHAFAGAALAACGAAVSLGL